MIHSSSLSYLVSFLALRQHITKAARQEVTQTSLHCRPFVYSCNYLRGLFSFTTFTLTEPAGTGSCKGLSGAKSAMGPGSACCDNRYTSPKQGRRCLLFGTGLPALKLETSLWRYALISGEKRKIERKIETPAALVHCFRVRRGRINATCRFLCLAHKKRVFCFLSCLARE